MKKEENIEKLWKVSVESLQEVGKGKSPVGKFVPPPYTPGQFLEMLNSAAKKSAIPGLTKKEEGQHGRPVADLLSYWAE